METALREIVCGKAQFGVGGAAIPHRTGLRRGLAERIEKPPSNRRSVDESS